MRGPFQDGRVIGSRHSRILNAYQVQLGFPPKQAADDIIVQVLIRGKTKHRLRASDPSHQALANSLGRMASLVLSVCGVCIVLSLLQVLVHFATVAKIIAQHHVDVCVAQGRLLLCDLFR